MYNYSCWQFATQAPPRAGGGGGGGGVRGRQDGSGRTRQYHRRCPSRVFPARLSARETRVNRGRAGGGHRAALANLSSLMVHNLAYLSQITCQSDADRLAAQVDAPPAARHLRPPRGQRVGGGRQKWALHP